MEKWNEIDLMEQVDGHIMDHVMNMELYFESGLSREEEGY